MMKASDPVSMVIERLPMRSRKHVEDAFNWLKIETVGDVRANLYQIDKQPGIGRVTKLNILFVVDFDDRYDRKR